MKSLYTLRRQTIPHIGDTLWEKWRLYCAWTTTLEYLVWCSLV